MEGLGKPVIYICENETFQTRRMYLDNDKGPANAGPLTSLF